MTTEQPTAARPRPVEHRRATINDVAEKAGVSKKTVSRVINASPLVSEDTRRQVQEAMIGLAYVPDPQARGLALRHAFLVGMIYDNPNPQYVVSMQEGILEALSGTEFELAVHRCDRASDTFLSDARRFVERQKLFGVILTPSVSEDDRLAEVLREVGCGFIRIASVGLDEPAHVFVSHDRTGGLLAARHLTELGHERVAHVAGLQGFRSSEERQAGFEAGLAEAGLALTPKHTLRGAYTFQSGVRAGRKLAGLSPRPTAVFAANDQMAAGVLHGLRVAGLEAPRDVSVVGFDDLQVAVTTSPQLTTIHSPTRLIGELAATRLLAGGGFAPMPDQRETEPHLTLRGSTGAPPA